MTAPGAPSAANTDHAAGVSCTFHAQPIGARLIVGPTSRLPDCWSPQPEFKVSPAGQTESGVLTAAIDAAPTLSPAAAPKVGRFPMMRRPTEVVDAGDRLVVDLRQRTPGNWAHILTNHLPLYLKLCRLFDISPAEAPQVVFPAEIPGYAAAVFEALGAPIIRTDGQVRGRFIRYEQEPWNGNRGVRTDIIAEELSRWPLFDAIRSTKIDAPENIFLARRGTRAILNEAPLDAFLEHRGFRKLYMETFKPLEQIAIVSRATTIVAVHGAALGPLIMRKALGSPPLKLLEIFGPGYVVNAFRVIAEQVGADWIGVHGVIDASVLPHLNRESTDAREYTLANFNVDVASVEIALDMLMGYKPLPVAELR